MKKSFYIGIIALLSACSAGSNETTPTKKKTERDTIDTAIDEKQINETAKKETIVKASSQEDKLMALIWGLNEVQTLNKEIETKSKGKRHLSTFIASEPSDDSEYYGISVAEDNGEAYATYFQFHVYPNNEIFYYDPIEDQEMSLSDWRKQKK